MSSYSPKSLSRSSTNRPTGGGNKKQDLVSRVGLGHWANDHVARLANGQNASRNVVFCMNQLGGVGAGKSMFRTANSYAKKSGIQRGAPSCRLIL